MTGKIEMMAKKMLQPHVRVSQLLVSAAGLYLRELLIWNLLGYCVSDRLPNRHFELLRYLAVC